MRAHLSIIMIEVLLTVLSTGISSVFSQDTGRNTLTRVLWGNMQKLTVRTQRKRCRQTHETKSRPNLFTDHDYKQRRPERGVHYNPFCTASKTEVDHDSTPSLDERPLAPNKTIAISP